MKCFVIAYTISAAVASAALTFDSTLKEIHAGADANELHCDFEFENKGDKVEEIVTFIPNCSCISAQISNNGKLIYQPGEKGTLRATFRMENFSGVVDKQVVIRMKEDPETAPSVNLTVRVHIPVLVQFDTKNVEWYQGEKLEPKTIKVTMNHDKPLAIVNLTSSNPAFSGTWKEVEKGKQYVITVTPDAEKAGTSGMAVFHLETDCAIEKQRKQMFFAILRNTPRPAPVPQQPGAVQLAPAPKAPAE